MKGESTRAFPLKKRVIFPQYTHAFDGKNINEKLEV